MMHVNDPETGIIMFTTESNIEYICQPDVEFFGDGIFKYCPRYFYRLYTLLGHKNGRYVPCVFFLLPSKSGECYTNMFRHLIEVARDFGHNFQLTSIHLDFEDAVFEAARVFWPTVIIKGCHFHLSQAWWRKIQSLGLATEYKSEESVIGKWLKVFIGLSFLNSENIEECFAFDLFSCTPDDPRAVRFADYTVHNYIEATSRYPPAIWSEPGLDVKRTTNGCKAFHRQFSDMFYNHHRNIYDFMEKINLIQTNNYLKIRAASRPLLLSTAEKRNLEQMKNIQRQYRNGEIIRKEYVKLMAYRA
jgi:hypothetical protein